MALRGIRDLNMPNPGCKPAQRADQFTAGALDVVHVALKSQSRYVAEQAVDQIETVEEEPWRFDRVQKLNLQRHLGGREAIMRAPEVVDEALILRFKVVIRQGPANQTVDLGAVEFAGNPRSVVDASGEFVDTRRIDGDAALSRGEIPCGQVEQVEPQVVGLQRPRHQSDVLGVREHVFDAAEAGCGRPFESIEKRKLLKEKLEVCGESRQANPLQVGRREASAKCGGVAAGRPLRSYRNATGCVCVDGAGREAVATSGRVANATASRDSACTALDIVRVKLVSGNVSSREQAMIVGLGLGHRARLSRDNFRFARQAGATHIVATLLNSSPANASGTPGPFLVSRSRPDLWSRDALVELRRQVEAEDLHLEAVESIEPADLHDVLLDGPLRSQQIAGLQDIIRNLGAAGIPMLGYQFSLAGVWGRRFTPVARGGARTWEFDTPEQPPIPRGMVWNHVYDTELFASAVETGATIGDLTSDELWRRYGEFLDAVLPVAEAAGVKLALHPDDPPVPTLRGTARLVYRPELYDRMLALSPSSSNCMEVCVGTLAEVDDSDIYQAMDHLSATGRIGYVHFRNVNGTVPRYREDFVDAGDTDMVAVLRILARNGYNGVLVPDHTPELDCDAPWHSGMAYALGWMRGALAAMNELAF
jgi:mannonate dehydratase